MLGKTVCIVGIGDIGTAIAQRLAPFGVKLKGVRRHVNAGGTPGFDSVHGLDDLSSAFSHSDIMF